MDDLNVTYVGHQEGFGSVPAYDLYQDNITGSSFGVLAGQSISEAAEECRRKFRKEK